MPCLAAQQVAEAPKKRKRGEKKETGDDEEAKPVVPLTPKEVLAERVADWLKAAALNRTSSLTLDGLGFADQLSTALLTQAKDMEALYKEIQTALNDTKDDEDYEALMAEMDKMMKGSEKMQVGDSSRPNCQRHHLHHSPANL